MTLEMFSERDARRRAILLEVEELKKQRNDASNGLLK